jgi:hypothetical protein
MMDSTWRGHEHSGDLLVGKLRSEATMEASVGDRIVIKGHKVGDVDRDCEILEVHGADGGPPYLVRWESGQEGLFFPGSDAVVHHFHPTRK